MLMPSTQNAPEAKAAGALFYVFEGHGLFEDHCLVSVDEYPVLQDIGEGSVKDQPLDVAAGSCHHVGGEVVVNLDDILLDDRAVVELLGDEVRSGADNLHAAVKGLLIGLRADECRQEGVMDVDYPVPERLQELGGDDAHVLGEDHIVRRVLLHGLKDLVAVLLAREPKRSTRSRRTS